ncbi:MAG TPA: hypothetical protein PK622_10580 [Saprospiraceae bacterium]|nr:hypothetical protein [Saprospiraceae bacterium]
MMKYIRSNLKKLEDLCQAIGYKVRYEQGHFQSGYCRVEARQIIVINKFFDVEGRINVLIELIPTLTVDHEKLSEDQLALWNKVVEFRPLESTQ